MANPEHLEILKQGVREWSQWRKDNPYVIPDLIEADLSGAKLIEANLSRANLIGANLIGANLSGADLSGANPIRADLTNVNLIEAKLSRAKLNRATLTKAKLSGAKLNRATLTEANLRGAILNRANLTEAKLSGAILSGATLTEVKLSGANLSRATLTEAKLSGANLTKANFTKANLTKANLTEAILTEAILLGAILVEANLFGANITKAILSGAILSGAILSGANLTEASLTEAILQNASLLASRLMDANFDGANLTKARLWETQRAGWSIKGVICESIYWDENGNEVSFYNPGEFERLFADKTIVRLFYKDGINPLEIATLPALIKHLEESHPGSGLRLVGIREDSGGVVVELAIEDEGNQSPEQLKQLKSEIVATAQRAIEYERKFLAEEKQRLQLEGALKQSDAIIEKLILRPSINVQGDYKNMGDEYNISGQAGAVGHNAHAHDMTFNQVVNHFDLPALAKQLRELREEMATRQDSSPQAVIAQGEAAKAEMAAKEGNTSKVVEYLKVGGQGLLDIAKETGKELLTAAIKASMGMQ